MIIFIKLFGIIMVIAGITFLINQDVIKKYLSFWLKGKRLYRGGMLALLFGIVFLFAAPQCNMPWFITLIGIIGLIKGVTILALGPKKWMPVIDWWLKRPSAVMRLLAIVEIALGILLIYSA